MGFPHPRTDLLLQRPLQVAVSCPPSDLVTCGGWPVRPRYCFPFWIGGDGILLFACSSPERWISSAPMSSAESASQTDRSCCNCDQVNTLDGGYEREGGSNNQISAFQCSLDVLI